MKASLRISALTAALLLVTATARAQVTTNEVEPNSVKAEATPVVGMVAGDMITGTTSGTGTTAGDSAVTTQDTFLVSTAAAPLGVYRHRLVITSTIAGHTGRILGLTQVAGVPTTTSVTLQSSTTATTPPRYVQWYGFGKAEQLYIQIVGGAATTAAYTMTLVTDLIAPYQLTDCIAPGTLTISTVGQGHTTDTDMWVYDSNLDAIPNFGNDDEPLGTTLQSKLTRSFAAGTYYIAMSTFHFANNQPAGLDDDFQTGTVMDFPNVAANSSTTATNVVNFEVTDGTKTIEVPASRVSQYDVVFVQLNVSSTPCVASSGVEYCFGENGCPCSNNTPVGAHQGCAHGVAGGAHLTSTGVASASADTLVLHATNLPFPPGGQGSILFFQGTTQVAAPFNDGKRCASGTVVRLGVKLHGNFSTFADFPGAGDPLISVKGAIGVPPATGSTRYYQGHYRTVISTGCLTGSNTTNGLGVVWIP